MVKRLKKIFRKWRNEVLTSGRAGITKALNALVGIITARLLLSEGKGELTTVLLWPNIFQGFGAFGLPHAVVYYTGLKKQNLEAVVGSTILIGIFQGLLIGIVGYLSVPLIITQYKIEIVRLTQTVFLCVPIFYISGYFLRILHGVGEFGVWNSIKIADKSVYASGVVLLWLNEVVSVQFVVYAYLLSSVVVLILGSISLANKVEWPRIDFPLIAQMLRYGGKNYLASLTGQANSRLDQALISAFLPARQLGLYRVAVSSSRTIRIVNTGIKEVLFSKTSRAETATEGTLEIFRSLRTSGLVLSLSAAALAIALPFLIPIAFGSEFEESVLAAEILLAAMVFWGMKQTLYNGIRGQGRPEVLFYAEAVGSVITGVGLYVLLQWMGIEGAAIASLLAYAGSFMFVWIFFKRHESF